MLQLYIQLYIDVDNDGLKARASGLDDMPTSNLSKSIAEMSIADDEGYDKFDAKSVMSKFSIRTSLTAPNASSSRRIAASSTSLRLPYRVHTWRDAQLRGRTSVIIHMLSGKSALSQMSIGLLHSDHSVLVIGHYYTEYMMDKTLAIYDPIMACDRFCVDKDPTGAHREKISAVLDNHPRCISFDRDVARMTRRNPDVLVFREEMHIKLDGPHDPEYVTYEEDNLHNGCYFSKDPDDKAKYLRIELKEESKRGANDLIQGLESDVMSIRLSQPRVELRGGGMTPMSSTKLPEQISIPRQEEDSDEEEDSGESDYEWEHKSFKSTKSSKSAFSKTSKKSVHSTSKSVFSFGTSTSASGQKKKKKLRVTTGNVTPASMSSKKSSNRMSYTGSTRSPMKVRQALGRSPMMTPQSRSSMKTPQSQTTHASHKRNAVSSLSHAAADLKDHTD